MYVIKRDSRQESVKFDKITSRLEKLSYGLDPNHVDITRVAKTVIEGLYDGVSTVELDNLAAETAAYLTGRHPDYAILAARIAVSNLHKATKKSFSQTKRATKRKVRSSRLSVSASESQIISASGLWPVILSP